jgi:uncharacterized membrane protein (UPF0127 family)
MGRTAPLLIAALALAAAGCSRHGGGEESSHGKPAAEEPEAPVPPASHPAAPDAKAAAVVFLLPAGGEVRVAVEVARTARQIQRGLMYREHLPPESGMLFLLRRDKIQTFWMKNTLIPLDMIFVSGAMDVVGVVENAEPKTLTSRRVSRPSQYVVEVNGGWAKAHGVGVGTRVRFENVPPIGPADGEYD